MGGLSEKAKGKQRAVETPVRGDGEPSTPPSREIIIRFTNGLPDLNVKVEAKDAARDIKRQVRPIYFRPA